MASKDSVRYLGQSMMGLGDRLSARAQRDVENSRANKSLDLQSRYQKLSESKYQNDMFSKKQGDAIQAFVTLQQMEQGRLAGERKVPAGQEGTVSMEAAKNVFAKLTPEQRKMLPGNFVSMLGGGGMAGNPDVPGSVGPSSGYLQPYPIKPKVTLPTQDPTIDLIRRMQLQTTGQ